MTMNPLSIHETAQLTITPYTNGFLFYRARVYLPPRLEFGLDQDSWPKLEFTCLVTSAISICTVFVLLPKNGPHKASSVGKPVRREMAIPDENGVDQKANVNGKMCIREGPMVQRINNPEANKTTFQFGWFLTGDLGYFDSQRCLNMWVAY